MKFILLVIFTLSTGSLCSFAKLPEEMESRIMHRNPTKEEKDYIDAIPPSGLKLIIKELMVEGQPMGVRDMLHGLAMYKMKQFDKSQTKYDRDYAFEKTVQFARMRISGNSYFGGSFMNYYRELYHPLVLELAKEILESEDELSRGNAKIYLKKHEEIQKAKKQRKNGANRVSKPGRMSEKERRQAENRRGDSLVGGDKENRSSQWLWIGLVIVITGGGIWYFKRKS